MQTTLMVFFLSAVFYLPLIYLFNLIVKALRKYLRSSEIRKEKNNIKKTLGEILKENRTKCKTTQEFVAESVGVSRQAVSKLESGVLDLSISNLLALAKLFGISVDDLLRKVKDG